MGFNIMKKRIVAAAMAGIMAVSAFPASAEPISAFDSSLTSASYSVKSSSAALAKAKFKDDYSSTENAIRLNWNKVNGASGYRIYRYNTETGKYEKIKTISDGSTTSYRNGKLQSATVYKYKIQAYKKVNDKTVWGAESEVKSTATKPEAVSFKSLSATTSSITLKWKAVNCDGYQIYQLKNGKYVKLATVKKGTVSYKVSGLSDNTKYTFKIRAYKRDGAGKTNFSPFTLTQKSTTVDKQSEIEKAFDRHCGNGGDVSDYTIQLIKEYFVQYAYDKWGDDAKVSYNPDLKAWQDANGNPTDDTLYAVWGNSTFEVTIFSNWLTDDFKTKMCNEIDYLFEDYHEAGVAHPEEWNIVCITVPDGHGGISSYEREWAIAYN
jgi:hypothetical protein